MAHIFFIGSPLFFFGELTPAETPVTIPVVRVKIAIATFIISQAAELLLFV
jgi:hypothetical protein